MGRASKGFNKVQTVALAEHGGLNLPNAYGDLPLSEQDMITPAITPGSDFDDPDKYDYWDHVEYFVSKADEYGIIVGLLPCWGEYVTPRFREATFTDSIQSYNYGHFLGNRLKKLDNLVWILGGEFDNKEYMEIDPSGAIARGNDWVLIIDNAHKKFLPPGESVY